MPWPLSTVWRYGLTAGLLVIGLQLMAPGLAGPAASLPALAGVPVWTAVTAAAVLGPLVPMALWARSVRPRRRGPRLVSIADEDRSYRRDLHAELLVDRRGFLFARRVLFTASGLPWRALRGLPRDYGERFVRPVAIHTETGWTWWIAGSEFYRVSAGYSLETVEAIVESLRWRRGPRLDAEAPESAGDERQATFLSACRPSLGRHNGLVCVRCRGTIDARDRAVEGLWTEVGLRAVDVRLHCPACVGSVATMVATGGRG